MNLQTLPKFQPRSDYQKYLHELKKNHHKAVEYLEEVRGKAAEFEKTAGHGFVNFKASALAACKLQAVKLVDGDTTWLMIMNTNWNEANEPFHMVNSLLDALIGKMKNEEPVIAPRDGGHSPVQVVQHQAQSQSQNMQLVMDLTKVITKNLANSDTTPKEKTFLQKVEEILPTINGGLDLMQKVLLIATQLGISIETVIKLLR
jgi:hypothetical protein